MLSVHTYEQSFILGCQDMSVIEDYNEQIGREQNYITDYKVTSIFLDSRNIQNSVVFQISGQIILSTLFIFWYLISYNLHIHPAIQTLE